MKRRRAARSRRREISGRGSHRPARSHADRSSAPMPPTTKPSSPPATISTVLQAQAIYYSAFSPIPDARRALPLLARRLVHEHRLYQADWLMRFYGFDAGEIVDQAEGMLSLDIVPELAWALRLRDRSHSTRHRQPRGFARMPGFGTRAVDRIIATRRVTSIRIADLARLRIPETRRCRSLPSAIIARRRTCWSSRNADATVQAQGERISDFGFDTSRHGRTLPRHERISETVFECTLSRSTTTPILKAGAKAARALRPQRGEPVPT